MAEFQYRHPLTASGRFYVDERCLDCFVCREALPSVFVLDEAKHTTYVGRQPSTVAGSWITCLPRAGIDPLGFTVPSTNLLPPLVSE